MFDLSNGFRDDSDAYKAFEIRVYNDNTFEIAVHPEYLENCDHLTCLWRFDSHGWTEDLFNLQCMMDELDGKIPVDLVMPYVPNARMDRHGENPRKAFTLKTFAKVINGMNFRKVTVLDPHSDVTSALIDRCEVVPAPLDFLKRIFEGDLVWVFPDAGAMHRYKGLLTDEDRIIFGEKARDWETKHITGYELYGGEAVRGKDVVIVDDIISHGYTLYFLLKEVAKYEPRSIRIFATHIEESFRAGRLYQALELHEDGFENVEVYTTDSIIRNRPPYKEETVGIGNIFNLRRIEI